MERYENRGGNSGVRCYEVAPDSITVQFSDGSAYLYDHESAGPSNIDRMKLLAARGVGLHSFIKTTVNDQSSRRLR